MPESALTIEVSFAFAKGKRVYASELPAEGALRALVAGTISPGDIVASLESTPPGEIRG